jgi:hypothetical protein
VINEVGMVEATAAKVSSPAAALASRPTSVAS